MGIDSKENTEAADLFAWWVAGSRVRSSWSESEERREMASSSL